MRTRTGIRARPGPGRAWNFSGFSGLGSFQGFRVWNLGLRGGVGLQQRVRGGRRRRLATSARDPPPPSSPPPVQVQAQHCHGAVQRGRKGRAGDGALRAGAGGPGAGRGGGGGGRQPSCHAQGVQGVQGRHSLATRSTSTGFACSTGVSGCTCWLERRPLSLPPPPTHPHAHVHVHTHTTFCPPHPPTHTARRRRATTAWPTTSCSTRSSSSRRSTQSRRPSSHAR